MKKHLILASVFLLALFLVACESQQQPVVEEPVESIEQTGGTEGVPDNTFKTYPFEEADILTFHSENARVEFGFYQADVVGQNNSDKAIKDVSMVATIRDKDKNVLSVSYPQYNAGVYPKSQFRESASGDTNDIDISKIAEVTVDTYSYYLGTPDKDGNNYFEVDKITKTAKAGNFE